MLCSVAKWASCHNFHWTLQKLFFTQHIFLAKHALRDLWWIPVGGIPDLFRHIRRRVDKQCFIYLTELQRAGEFERLFSSALQWPSDALLCCKPYSLDQYAAGRYQLHFGRFLVLWGAFLQVNRHALKRKTVFKNSFEVWTQTLLQILTPVMVTWRLHEWLLTRALKYPCNDKKFFT